jgi:hypothetical protein
VVEKEKARMAELREQLGRVRAQLKTLGGKGVTHGG